MINWLDKRYSIKKSLKKARIPRSWRSWFYFFGFLSLITFIWQAISGAILSMYFFNSKPEDLYILKASHYISAQILIISFIFHGLQKLYQGAYKKPRELHWISGIILSLLIFFNYCIGVFLLNNTQSKKSQEVFNYILKNIPYIGEFLKNFLFSCGRNRLYAIHISTLPIFIILILLLHLWFVSRTGLRNKDQKRRIL